MLDLLHTIFAFILAIGVLVAVHEWGHFIVARAVGVKVLRFSIGFGRKLYGWTSSKSETEYRIAWLPLGGYVKMLDEREGPVAEEDLHRAFNRQVLWKRVVVVLAGPAMNFVFALVAYWFVFMVGVTGFKPVIDEVPAHSRAYEAGMRAGDEVLRVDGKTVDTFSDLRASLLEGALAGESLTLEIRRGELNRNLRLSMHDLSADPETLFPAVGLNPYRPTGAPVVRGTLDGGAAQLAGIQAGDVIIAGDGTAFSDVREFVRWVEARPRSPVVLRLQRDGQEIERRVQLAGVNQDGKVVGRLGAKLGVDVNPEIWQDLRATKRYGPLQSIPKAVAETWQLSVLTVRLIGRMLVGDVSWRNIGGPIQIAEYAGATAEIGLVSFLEFMALVSVSLGVLNLLPIPILDGGHLLYYIVEAFRGQPLSLRAQAVGQQVGVFLLIALMSVAFYNDIYRLGSG